MLRRVQVLLKVVPGGNWLPSGMVSSTKAAWSQPAEGVGEGSSTDVGITGSVGRLRVGAEVGTAVGGAGVSSETAAVCNWAAWSVATIWVESASTVRAASVWTRSNGSVGVGVFTAGWQAPSNIAVRINKIKVFCACIIPSCVRDTTSITLKNSRPGGLLFLGFQVRLCGDR